mmetsp:Transcript_24286/g.79226  ORF Transcript_24286/g.79226 Transcript_24286/m.79226 type:complete len:231 (-) Transcript_24286:8-700(-)
MSSEERDDLLIVEAHAVEDVPHVSDGRRFGSLVSVRKSSIGWTPLSTDLVTTTRTEWNFRSTHLFDGDNRCEDPEISIRQSRELSLDGLQSLSSLSQPSVGSEGCFWREAHGGPVASASLCLGVVSPRGMPRQPDKDRPDASVIVVILVQDSLYCISDLAVIRFLTVCIGCECREAYAKGRCYNQTARSPLEPGSPKVSGMTADLSADDDSCLLSSAPEHFCLCTYSLYA